LLATACTGSEEVPQPESNGTVTFTARVEGNMKAAGTRALDATDGSVSRALLEIYDADDTLVGSRLTGTIEGDIITFNANLEKGDNYTCLFWADGGSDAYNVDDLKAITRGSNPSVAYFAKEDIIVSEVNTEVTLKHAVAKVVLEESGTLTAGDKVGVSFSLPIYTFDVTDGSCDAGTAETISKEYTIATVTNGQVGAFYLFAPADGTTPLTMTLSYTNAGSDTKETHNISNVPLKRNYRTVLRGAFEELDVTVTQDFNVDLDKEWDVDEKPYILKTTAAGEITADPSLIQKALNRNGSLIVQGPVDNVDVRTIGLWAKETENAGKLKAIDLSAATEFTEIKANGFSGVSSLTSVILPPQLERIWNPAFNATSIVEIDIPENVNLFGASAFANNPHLKRIKMPAKLTTISQQCFQNCTGLTQITLTESTLGLMEKSFANSGLTSITLPSKVHYIKKAFDGCLSLKSVIFESDKSIGDLVLLEAPFPNVPEISLFFPNITDEAVATEYYNFFADAEKNPGMGLKGVYYNYTGDADGDRMDIANYTAVNP
ncbi:leucine-rich repeat domain-containing protein, partial [Parabacteroides sp. OttesenSCG-928-K15]|nr:leucine-rich repeat domain-containing protein [Parabacteroides sp. OttesenSCG-928-K15]